MIKIAINQMEFLEKLEFLVKKDKLTYVEAICQIAYELGLEPEDLSHLVTNSIKEKIKLQFRKNSSNIDLTKLC